MTTFEVFLKDFNGFWDGVGVSMTLISLNCLIALVLVVVWWWSASWH